MKKYWKLLSELAPIHEIYGENRLAPENISIDHFVPWSYVAHDEFWNLHPTTRAINSSKSNHLPEWELYFPRFAGLEYLSYQMMWKYEAVRNEFKKCAREHLNNPEIEHRLYREGLGACGAVRMSGVLGGGGCAVLGPGAEVAECGVEEESNVRMI